jgi:hypothetical protein
MIRKRIEETDDAGRRTTTIVEEPDDHVEAEDEYTEVDHGPGTAFARVFSMLALWVALAGLVVLAILAFRMGFEMAGANPDNDFVDFVYDISGPLVEPFDGIADDRNVEGGGVFRPETAIAMGVYLIATGLTMAVLGTIASSARSADPGPGVHRTRMVRGH